MCLPKRCTEARFERELKNIYQRISLSLSLFPLFDVPTFLSFFLYISKSETLILYLLLCFKIVEKTNDVFFPRNKFVFGRRAIPDRSILGSGCSRRVILLYPLCSQRKQMNAYTHERRPHARRQPCVERPAYSEFSTGQTFSC